MSDSSDMKQRLRDRIAVIILCGGKSSRMGYAKWQLPFGDERMLDRILRITREVSETQIVVAARDQSIDGLPKSVRIAFDERSDRGPLQGIHSGMAALPAAIDAAFVTSCDVPLLSPAFVFRLFDLLTAETQVVVPVEEKYHHPLAAVYRRSVLPVISDLLQADRLRPVFLYDEVETRCVWVEDFCDVDAQLNSLKNLNDAESYLNAIRQAGFDPNDIPESVLKHITRIP